MTEEAQDPATQIAAQATEWLLANRDAPDPSRQAAFVAWLKAHPAHAQAYAEALKVTSTLQRALTPVPPVEELVQLARRGSPANVHPIGVRAPAAPPAVARRRWLYAVAAAVIPAVALLSLWENSRHAPPPVALAPGEHFATGHGQQLAQSLADGSVLHLNTDSAVTVRYGGASRWVELEHGQVVFEVAHDAARPFRVTAGSAQVIAVGTRFDVYLQGESTVVTVVEGRVTVGATTGGAGAPLLVRAGEQVRVVQGVLPAQPTAVDPARMTAWLARQISVRHAPLAEVAAEFNRYTTTPIQIDTPRLRELPVSGVFNVDDTDSMVAFLRSLDGVTVELTPTAIRVSGH